MPKIDKQYIFQSRASMAQQEKVLEDDLKRGIMGNDGHWDTEQMRISFNTNKGQ